MRTSLAGYLGKMRDGKNLHTVIRPLAGEDRLREIARMLSGADITPEALANARVLLDRNKSNNY